jgi:predicted DNA-binding transcriptional regulator AlpA
MASKTHPRKYLSINEVADMWGLEPTAVRRRIVDGRLPAVRLSARAIRIRIEDAEAMGTPVQSALQ